MPLNAYLENVNKQEGVEIVLSEENCFCFENYPFRMLWAMRQGVQYTDEEYETCSKAWKKSQAEMRRLIKSLLEIKPHT